MMRSTAMGRANEIHLALRGAIESGHYRDGARLPSETALAKLHGVSRPVVREAISKLSAEGLVRAERGRGTFVTPKADVNQLLFSPIADVQDLLMWQDLRIAIEQEAARLAAERHDAEDMKNIRNAHDRLVGISRAGEPPIDADLRFHLTIAKATHNRVLVEAQGSLGDHIHNWMSTMPGGSQARAAEPGGFREWEHLAIVEAIERRDPELAAQAARRHIENGRVRFLAGLSANATNAPHSAVA